MGISVHISYGSFQGLLFRRCSHWIDWLCQSSGWMITDNLQFILHTFVKHTLATKHNTVWLLCDNHESHISVEGLDYTSENGIVMLSCTPHCPHKLHSLDHTLYSCKSWMYYIHGKVMTIMKHRAGWMFLSQFSDTSEHTIWFLGHGYRSF